MTDLAFTDAIAQAGLVRSGDATPLELVDAAIDRIERANGDLNAVIHPRFERARAEAGGGLPDGPFRGVPCLVKDLDGLLADEPWHGGNRALKAAGFRPTETSYLFEKLQQAGFVIVGKTNTPEFGLMPTTEPEAYGPSRNPWSLDCSTGGSSGGSAAAVASGMVPVAHAGDGGGSIRIPASECGLVGLKPSRGRHSLGPEAGEAWGGLVARGVVTRTVRDTAGVLDVISGAMPGDPYTAPPPSRPYRDEVGADPGTCSIGLLTEAPDPSVDVDPVCVEAVGRTAELLRSLGHRVADDHPVLTAETNAELTSHFVTAFGVWTLAELERAGGWIGRALRPDDVEAGTWAIAEGGRAASTGQYLDALEHFNRFTRELAAWWDTGHDLLVTPTLAGPPPKLGDCVPLPDNPLNGLFRAATIVPFTVPFNITGQPAMSLPLHSTDDGLPVGVQLVAAYGREDLLLRVAAQLEAAAPWADRIPPVRT